VGELRRQLGALSKAIQNFEDLAERKLEQHHTKSRSLLAQSGTLTNPAETSGQESKFRVVWSRPEALTRKS
jgi:hypothetical protein